MKEPSNEPLDLDVDLSQVDPTFPVLPSGLYDLKIADVTKEENSRKDGFNYKFTFHTTESAESVQGSPVEPGFPLYAYFPIQAKSDAADKEGWKKNFAMLLDAALGTTTGDRPKFSKSIVLNKIVRASVKVDEFEGRPTNKVGSLQHPE